MAQDVLVPRVEDIREIDMSDVKWVLILEKEVGAQDSMPERTEHALIYHEGRLPQTRKKQLSH